MIEDSYLDDDDGDDDDDDENFLAVRGRGGKNAQPDEVEKLINQFLTEDNFGPNSTAKKVLEKIESHYEGRNLEKPDGYDPEKIKGRVGGLRGVNGQNRRLKASREMIG